MPKGKQLTVV